MLVATTVIEVGVDVPNATLMIVEGAERFGLAQLHQLRGRVGRGEGASRCLLLRGQQLSETGRARLALMRETNDGFRIAEEDLRLRGPGEILGTRQSGEQGFRVATPEDVAELAPIAQGDARLLLDRDGGLASERGQAARLCLYLFERDAAVGLLRSGLVPRRQQPSASSCARLELQQPCFSCQTQRHALETAADRSTVIAVQPDRALADLAPRLAVGRGEAQPGQRLDDRRSALGDLKRRQVAAAAPSSKVRRAVSAAASPPLPRPCSIAVASLASTILASLIAWPSSFASSSIRSSGRSVNSFRNLTDIGIGGVPPELPIIIGRQLVGVEPHRAARGLAHLGAVGGGDQRRRDAEQLGARPSGGASSMPLTILPHWSDPPSCSRQPGRSDSSRKS